MTTTEDLAGTGRPRRRPASVTDLPLTPAQQRLWFIDRYQPGWPSHDEIAYRLRGPLDVAALTAALDQVFGRHEALWARFVDRDGEPVQVFGPPGRLAVEVVDLGEVPADERDQRVGGLVGALRTAPFDLSVAPLAHVTLIRLADDDHVLCMVLHHIVSDGSSWSILLVELTAAYLAARAGDRTPQQAPPLDFGDYVLWQQARAAGSDDHLGYWRELLSGAPVLALPTDLPRPPERGGRGGTVHRGLGGALKVGSGNLDDLYKGILPRPRRFGIGLRQQIALGHCLRYHGLKNSQGGHDG